MLPYNFTLDKIQKDVVEMLSNGLMEHYYYHSLRHTLDVVAESQRIADAIGIHNDDRDILLVAAWFHDVGFIISASDHEKHGCDVMKNYFGSSAQSNWTEAACSAIMATKIPQSPINLIGEILCDADLDYLGRSDFKEIGNDLFRELKSMNILQTELEWNLLQQRFLKQHHYFTETNKQLRDDLKKQHLLEIEQWLIDFEANKSL